MKTFTSLLLLCICIVGCKKEDFPIRESPITFFEEINIFASGTHFFLSDFDGRILNCAEIDTTTDYIVPDSINQLEGYHLTFFSAQLGQGSEVFYQFKTYTHIKTNRLKYTPITLSNNSYSTKLVRFKIDTPPEELEFVITQSVSLNSNHASNPNVNLGYVRGEAEHAYISLKRKEEDFIRFSKSAIPQNLTDSIDVIVQQMDFLSDSIVFLSGEEDLIWNISIKGILNCEIKEMIPLSFFSSDNEYYFIHQDAIEIDNYFSTFVGYTDDSKKQYYFSYRKSKKADIPIPTVIRYHLFNSDFEKFHIGILKQSNSIAETSWFSKIGNDNITWNILGDYQSKFEGPRQLPECLGLDFSNLPTLDFYELKIFEGSEFDNYQDFVKHKLNKESHFFERSLCDSSDEEYYDRTIISID